MTAAACQKAGRSRVPEPIHRMFVHSSVCNTKIGAIPTTKKPRNSEFLCKKSPTWPSVPHTAGQLPFAPPKQRTRHAKPVGSSTDYATEVGDCDSSKALGVSDLVGSRSYAAGPKRPSCASGIAFFGTEGPTKAHLLATYERKILDNLGRFTCSMILCR